jgi:hypothetical protein
MGFFGGGQAMPQMVKNKAFWGGGAPLLSILPGGPVASQIANPAGLTDSKGNAVTCIRATTNYCRKSPTFDASNLLQYAETIYPLWTAAPAGNLPVLTPNAAPGPDGTKTALRADFQATPGASDRSIYYQFNSLSAGTYTVSFYVKGVSGSGTLYYNIQGAVSLDSNVAFDASTWTRATFTFTTTAASTAVVFGSDRAVFPAEPAAPAFSVYLWGAKLEQAASATPYVSPMLVAIGANIPRVEPEGLLLEGSATNLAVQSQDFTTTWTGIGTSIPTVTADQAIAPDGTLTADRLQVAAISGVGNYGDINQPRATAAGVHTASLYIRGRSGSGTIYLALLDGTSSTWTSVACNYTSTTWTRFSCSATLSAGTNYFVIGVDLRTGSGQSSQAAQDVYIWGAQLEAATKATSYIPTTTASSSRPSDIFTGQPVPLTKTQGSVGVTVIPNTTGTLDASSGSSFNVDNGGLLSAIYCNGADPNMYLYDGATAHPVAYSFVTGVPKRYVTRWSPAAATINNITDGTSSAVTAPLAGSAMTTYTWQAAGGAAGGVGFWVKDVVVFNTTNGAK